MLEIKNRHTGKVMCTGETVAAACAAHRTILLGADLRGADLRGADIRGANLYMADLSEADLRGADLREADLRGADLRGADLRGAEILEADLRGADLYGSDLSGAYLNWANLRGACLDEANLRGACLDEAILDGAKLAWKSHDLMAELLRRAAGGDIAKRKVAGLIAISRDMCWQDFLAIGDPMTDWAISVLREYVVAGDDSPEAVQYHG